MKVSSFYCLKWLTKESETISDEKLEVCGNRSALCPVPHRFKTAAARVFPQRSEYTMKENGQKYSLRSQVIKTLFLWNNHNYKLVIILHLFFPRRYKKYNLICVVFMLSLLDAALALRDFLYYEVNSSMMDLSEHLYTVLQPHKVNLCLQK